MSRIRFLELILGYLESLKICLSSRIKKNDLYLESECRKSGTITIIAIAQVNLYGMF